uniref:Peptidase S74 domain-containing protein n=1 Tax=Escherichia phage 1-6bf TaxID=3117708 RepID=A0AAU6NU68_9CAUD
MISYNNSAPNAVNNVGQFGATEGSIGAYKSAAEYAADSKYWAMLSQKNYNSIDEILKEVERLYAEGSLLKEDIEQLKFDFENQNQMLLGLIQQTVEAVDNTNTAIGEANAATDRANQAVQDVLTQLDKVSNMSVVATTLPPGAPATGSFDNSTGVFSFGIPEGQPGKDGTDGTISDIGDVAISTPVADDYGFFVDKDNGGLYRTPMSEIAKLVPAVVSFNGRTGPVIPAAGDYTVSQVTGAAASGVNNDINQIRGLTTALSVAQGGTGAKDAANARINLSVDRLTQLTSGETQLRNGTGSAFLYVNKDGDTWGCYSSTGTGPIALKVNQGGTGARDAAGARTNLGLGPISTLDTVPIVNGGTGATTVVSARENLGVNRVIQGGSYSDFLTANGSNRLRIQDNGAWGSSTGTGWIPLGVGQGGTGATTADAARMSLVAAKSGANSDITSMTNKVTFTQSPVIPDAVANNEPVALGQLSTETALLETKINEAKDAAAAANTNADSRVPTAQLSNTSNVAQGDALIGVKAPFAGAAARTQHDINAQFSSILDFLGDKYNGTTDAASSFISANTLLPKSREIIVPSGTYLLNSNVECYGRRFVFEEPVTFTGAGKFYGAIVNRIMSDGTTKVSQWAKPGTTERMTTSAVFGDNGVTSTGIQIGGAVPYNGADGIRMFTDGSSGWLGVRASKWPHPTEMAIYPSSKSGSCQTISGSNAVKILSGASITSEAIGKPIAIYDALYTVASVTADGFTVKNINGSPVTWGSNATHSYSLCYYHGSGVCSVSGTTVTRISGDPFVIPDASVPQTMTINGVDYRVVAFTDPQHVTLSSAPGDSASTEYKFWGTVNNLNSALRVHRINDAGFEENISLIANNSGYYALHAAASNPANEQYPLYIGSGWEDNGQMRRSIISAANGDVTLGGNYGNGPLYVPYSQTSNPQIMLDNRNGNATVTVSGGSTPDASLTIKSKGAGKVVFHSEVGVNAAMYPYVDNIYSCGKSGNRWSQIWSSNATIQTSDGTTKTEVQGSNLSTDFILGLNPVSYKNIVGGNIVEEIEDGVEEIERQVVEKVVSTEEVHERVVDGDEVYYVRKFVDKEVERPVFHEVDLRDELGNVIGTIKTPLMEKVTVPKTRQVITEVPGKRTHYGFIAQEVKDLVDKLGISDFGGYVEGEDGKLGLRYGEFISPIVSCLQDIIKRLELLEKK